MSVPIRSPQFKIGDKVWFVNDVLMQGTIVDVFCSGVNITSEYKDYKGVLVTVPYTNISKYKVFHTKEDSFKYVQSCFNYWNSVYSEMLAQQGEQK